MATLLTIVQDAAGEIGIEKPTTVIGSTDTDAAKLLAMSNREGRSLARSAEWTVLQRLHTFTTTASTEEYALPTDYDRLITGTEWDRSDYEPLIGPISPQHWQAIKSGLIGQGIVDRRYRIVRSSTTNLRTFRVDPTPTANGDTLAFEYISNQWCAASDDTLQSEWAADTDVNLLNDDLMRVGLIVRYKRSVGLDYASEADEYGQMLDAEKGQDRPSPTLSLVSRNVNRVLGWDNLAETIDIT